MNPENVREKKSLNLQGAPCEDTMGRKLTGAIVYEIRTAPETSRYWRLYRGKQSMRHNTITARPIAWIRWSRPSIGPSSRNGEEDTGCIISANSTITSSQPWQTRLAMNNLKTQPPSFQPCTITQNWVSQSRHSFLTQWFVDWNSLPMDPGILPVTTVPCPKLS